MLDGLFAPLSRCEQSLIPRAFTFSDETWSLRKGRSKRLERPAPARDLAVKSEKNFDGFVLTQRWSVEKPPRLFWRWWVAKKKKINLSHPLLSGIAETQPSLHSSSLNVFPNKCWGLQQNTVTKSYNEIKKEKWKQEEKRQRKKKKKKRKKKQSNAKRKG